MRDIARIDRLQELITEYWKLPQNEDMRYFQFISYLERKIQSITNKHDLFFVEDDVIIKLIETYIKTERIEE